MGKSEGGEDWVGVSIWGIFGVREERGGVRVMRAVVVKRMIVDWVVGDED